MVYKYGYDDLYIWDTAIEWVEENPADDRPLYDAIQLYKEKTEIELINARSEMRTSTKDDELKNTHLKAIRLVLCWKLKVVPKQELVYMVKVLKSVFEDVYKEINEIKGWKNHRHKTIGGLYTEKAVY